MAQALGDAATVSAAGTLRNTAAMMPVNGESVHLQVDGEYAGQLPATVDVVPDALTLLVPAAYGKARPAALRVAS